MIFPVWLNVVLALVIALVEYFQQQTTVALSDVVMLVLGAVQVAAGVLMAFQKQVTMQARKAFPPKA